MLVIPRVVTVVIMALAALASGCNCKTVHEEGTILLRQDELTMKCEDVCSEAIDNGYKFESCVRIANPPSVACTWSLEVCGSGDHF